MNERKYHIGAFLFVVGLCIAYTVLKESKTTTTITSPFDGMSERSLPTVTPTPQAIEFSAWLPSFQEGQALSSIGSGSALLSTILPEWYQIDHTGHIVNSALPVRTEILQLTKEAKIRILPSVTANDPDRISAFLSHPEYIKQGVERLRTEAKAYFYVGIDVRFDNIPATQAGTFIEFIKTLQDSLSRQEQILSITVPFKASQFTEKIAAFPLDSFVHIADELRLFLVPYAGTNDREVTPLSFNDLATILSLAKQTIPKEKLVIGIPVTSADWDNRLVIEQPYKATVAEVTAQHGSLIRSKDSGFLTTTFLSRGLPHTVFIPDARTIQEVVALISKSGVQRISFWYISGEDPNVWNIPFPKVKE